MIWNVLLDLVYPRVCACCGRKPEDDTASHLCWDCLSDIEFVKDPFCALCGDPVDGRVDGDFVCYNCTAASPGFDRARSAGRYRGVLKEMLRMFKYRDGLWLARDLAQLLESCVATHFDAGSVDAVTFVPLYPARPRQRGFNQAEVLARALARRIGRPVLGGCLARVRPTGTQTHLTARDRATNVRGAFRTGWRRPAGKRLLLVDDVMTTGATVSECSRVLKEGGASAVQVVTVARG